MSKYCSFFPVILRGFLCYNTSKSVFLYKSDETFIIQSHLFKGNHFFTVKLNKYDKQKNLTRYEILNAIH